MALTERITSDLKAALKKGASERLGTLRFLSSELYNKSKEKQGKGLNTALTDEEATAVLRKEAKRRREALELFRKGNRADLVSKEEAELKIVEEYLPPAVSREEIAAAVDEILGRGVKEANALMREIMKKFKDRGADGRLVGELIKEKVK